MRLPWRRRYYASAAGQSFEAKNKFSESPSKELNHQKDYKTQERKSMLHGPRSHAELLVHNLAVKK